MKKQLYIGLGGLFFLVGMLSCIPIETKKSGYNFDKPTEKIILPLILDEISGQTVYSPTSLACIQDELGVIYIYDFVEREIVEEINFAAPGDYEGITRVGTSFYVLRSDGLLFQVEHEVGKEVEVVSYETNIPSKNNEGLCYDKENNRLLIGSKSKSGKEASNNERNIYAFNLATKTMEIEPVFTLQKQAIIDYAKTHKIDLPYKVKKKTGKSELNLKLGVSAISIHPKTKELYVLSAGDYMLLVYDVNLALKKVYELDPVSFPQAEGITFYANGDVFISSEGKGGDPRLMKFEE